MKLGLPFALVLVFATLALPLVTAAPPSPGPLVGVCVDGVTTQSGCYGGHDVCIGFSYQVPQCADIPCGDGSCITIEQPPDLGLVSVCVDGVTTSYGCYGGHDVCVNFSRQVPFCADLPSTKSTLP